MSQVEIGPIKGMPIGWYTPAGKDPSDAGDRRRLVLGARVGKAEGYDSPRDAQRAANAIADASRSSKHPYGKAIVVVSNGVGDVNELHTVSKKGSKAPLYVAEGYAGLRLPKTQDGWKYTLETTKHIDGAPTEGPVASGVSPTPPGVDPTPPNGNGGIVGPKHKGPIHVDSPPLPAPKKKDKGAIHVDSPPLRTPVKGWRTPQGAFPGMYDEPKQGHNPLVTAGLLAGGLGVGLGSVFVAPSPILKVAGGLIGAATAVAGGLRAFDK